MKLEVTEREAYGVMYNRHMRKYMWPMITLLVVFVLVGVVVAELLPDEMNIWLQGLIMCGVAAPFFFVYMKILNAVTKKADQDMIELKSTMKGELS